jgi:uncharacterized protein YwgA
MDTRLAALAFFLEALGINSSIDTLEDRKRVQKAVYLGQLSGVDLGYSHGWYIRGPYSPELTRDYFSLAEEIEDSREALEGKALRPEVIQKLEHVRPVMQIPGELERTLTVEDWLELVASYHFLRAVSGYNKEKTQEVFAKQKPRLAPYTEIAARVLTANSLLDQA